LFRAEAPHMLAEIRAAVVQADAERLARAAHKMCGAVSYLNAPDLELAARRLETLGREVKLDPAPSALAHLEQCVARFEPTLAPGGASARTHAAEEVGPRSTAGAAVGLESVAKETAAAQKQ
jgi:HPt (histidine-containing phosphotransfer) domain-containing protein